MKTKNRIITAALLSTGLLLSAFTLPEESIRGNGNVVTRERTVSPFTELEVTGTMNVFLSQGASEAVKVETDENLQEIIEIISKDNKLIVQCKKGISIKKSTKANVYVTIKNITKLNSDGVGNIESTSSLTLQNLNMNASGVGNTTLDLTCKKLNAIISAVGNVKLKGNAEEAILNASGTGNLNASDFKVKKLSAKVSGVGNASVHADEEITINASGIGNISYTGDAPVKKISSDGIGKVKRN